MLRRIFVLLASAVTAVLGFFLWNKRGELKAEVGRMRGERRSGAEGKPKVEASRRTRASSGDGKAAGSKAARDTGAEPAPERARSPSTPEVADAAEGAARAEEAGTEEARTTPRDESSAPTSEEEEQRCVATTNAGTRCTRAAEPGSDRCWQHAE